MVMNSHSMNPKALRDPPSDGHIEVDLRGETLTQRVGSDAQRCDDSCLRGEAAAGCSGRLDGSLGVHHMDSGDRTPRSGTSRFVRSRRRVRASAPCDSWSPSTTLRSLATTDWESGRLNAGGERR